MGISFIDDKEKMRDFADLSKEDFLNSYSYLNEDDYLATLKDIQIKIKKIKQEIDYEKRKQEVCATGKSDIYYLDSLQKELEELKEKADNVGGMECPLCAEELDYIPYKSKNGKIIHIYSHDNTCPFIAFELVDNEDLDGFIEYIRNKKEVNYNGVD